MKTTPAAHKLDSPPKKKDVSVHQRKAKSSATQRRKMYAAMTVLMSATVILLTIYYSFELEYTTK